MMLRPLVRLKAARDGRLEEISRNEVIARLLGLAPDEPVSRDRGLTSIARPSSSARSLPTGVIMRRQIARRELRGKGRWVSRKAQLRADEEDPLQHGHPCSDVEQSKRKDNRDPWSQHEAGRDHDDTLAAQADADVAAQPQRFRPSDCTRAKGARIWTPFA
jgi:hypothetical protein